VHSIGRGRTLVLTVWSVRRRGSGRNRRARGARPTRRDVPHRPGTHAARGL